MDDEDRRPPIRVIGGYDRSGRLWVLGLFAAGGAVLGAVLPILVRWAAELPWMPFQGPLRLIGSFDQSWLLWARPLIGVVAGLAFAAWVIFDSPVLEVGPDRVTVRRRGEVQRVIDRDKVAAVHPKGSNTVIETDTGRILFEGEVEGGKARIRSAFVEHGYPWEGPGG